MQTNKTIHSATSRLARDVVRHRLCQHLHKEKKLRVVGVLRSEMRHASTRLAAYLLKYDVIAPVASPSNIAYVHVCSHGASLYVSHSEAPSAQNLNIHCLLRKWQTHAFSYYISHLCSLFHIPVFLRARARTRAPASFASFLSDYVQPTDTVYISNKRFVSSFRQALVLKNEPGWQEVRN